ncbi:diacylglycerol/lipid kinase family protein [Acidobacteriota bacterium]
MPKVTPPNHKRITCVINPYAANKKWQRNALLRKYLQKNLPGKIIDNPEDKAYTVETVKKLCKDNDIIVAAGGDGTIADVIQGIMDSGRMKDVALGIIPFGSGNAFITSLGIPKNIARAIKIIKEGKTREVDLIDIEGKAAAFASVGATAQVLVEKLQHNIPGFFGHLLASRIMLKLASIEQEIQIYEGIDDAGNHFDHRKLKLKVFDCVLGKASHFGYNWKVSPEAVIDDGYIDITLFEIPGWKYWLFFPSIYFGTFQKTQKHFKAKRIVLSGRDLPVQYNGELMGIKDKVEMRILPCALKIVSPAKMTVAGCN